MVLTSLDPNTPTTGFHSKYSLVTFSLNLNQHISLKGEQGTNYKDQLSNKMGKGLFKPHGLYFSANITDTTQIPQSEVTQTESRGLQQVLEIKLGRRSGITGKRNFAA